MEFSNKENIPMKQMQPENIPMKQIQPDISFLSCTETLCEPMIESKPQNQKQQPQHNLFQHHHLYQKIVELSVKSSVDPALVENDRVLMNLIRAEPRYLPKYNDYFRTVQVEVKAHMRKVVADWMFDVSRELGCNPDVFCLAMNLMDRFLAKCRIYKSQFQLLGAVCLFLSSKFKEGVSPISSEKLAEYTDFAVSPEDIFEMELLVLYKLKWDLGATTPIDYLDYILPKLQLQTQNLDMAYVRKHTETVIVMTATEYTFSYVRPSVMAASAMAVTYRSLVSDFSQGDASLFLAHLQAATHADIKEIEACSSVMIQILPEELTLPKEVSSSVQSSNSGFSNSSFLVKSC